MQAQVAPRPNAAPIIWKWGAIGGVILGVVGIPVSLLSLGLVGTLINLVVWLVGFFVIGMLAARQTGRVGTGSLAGLVTGLISGVISALFGVIEILANSSQITNAINQAQQNAQQQGQTISSSELHTIVVVGVIIGLVISVAFELGLGAGIGALGGLVGRNQAAQTAAPVPYVEAMWTPPPPPPPGPGMRQE